MRINVLFFALLIMNAGAVSAQAHVKILDAPADLDTYGPAPAERKAGHDSVSDALLLPYFEASGESSTLFSVRNEAGRPLAVRILYLTLTGEEQVRSEIQLRPRETRTFNLRDAAGLPRDNDGAARGMVILGSIGERGDLLSGDYFILAPATGEATGGALLNISLDDPGNELCSDWGARLLNGGGFNGHTRLRLVADWPAGTAPFDPPTAVGTAYDENGSALRSFEVRTDAHSFELETAELLPTGVAFGSLEVRFLGAPGAVIAEHSGMGSLSIALKAVCRR